MELSELSDEIVLVIEAPSIIGSGAFVINLDN